MNHKNGDNTIYYIRELAVCAEEVVNEDELRFAPKLYNGFKYMEISENSIHSL